MTNSIANTQTPTSSIPDSEAVVYRRDPSATVLSNGQRFINIRPDRSASICTHNAYKLGRVVACLTAPMTAHDLARSTGLNGNELEHLLSYLSYEHVITTAPQKNASLDDYASSPTCKRIILGITGSIGAITSVDVALLLRARFCKDVQIILTEAATEMVAPAIFRYHGFSVWTTAFEARDDVNVPHIHLAMSADLVVVVPACANTLHRLATAECSDLLSLVVTATRAPIVVSPAMNTVMLDSFAVRRNIAQLKEDGVYVVETRLGFEASGKNIDDLTMCSAGLYANNVVHICEAVVRSR